MSGLWGVLLLLSGGWSFSHPELRSQPVVVIGVDQTVGEPGEAGEGGVDVRLENRSTKEVVELALVGAGESCTSKPAWPGITWRSDGPPDVNGVSPEPLEPGGTIVLHLPGPFLERIAAVSRRTCKREAPIELGITRVLFADGTVWDLGVSLRGGERWSP